MENRTLGLVLVAVSIVMFILTSSFTIEINESMMSSCDSCAAPGEPCPHAGNLPWQSYLGFSVSFLVLVLGLYLIVSGSREKLAALKRRKEIRGLVKNLNKDEMRIFELMSEADGAIFQSELVEKAGFPKVKVTRILDRLEGKGLLERRRRGMSNVVMLKHKG
jgi:uncharacterized membrane protein